MADGRPYSASSHCVLCGSSVIIKDKDKVQLDEGERLDQYRTETRVQAPDWLTVFHFNTVLDGTQLLWE